MVVVHLSDAWSYERSPSSVSVASTSASSLIDFAEIFTEDVLPIATCLTLMFCVPATLPPMVAVLDNVALIPIIPSSHLV